MIGERLRRFREQQGPSLRDIEESTGLLTCYISRVENGHTVPTLETLERLASVLDIPLYQLFYEGDEPPVLPDLRKRQSMEELFMDEESEKEMRFFEKVRRLTSRIDEKDRGLASVPRRPMLVLETIGGGGRRVLEKALQAGVGAVVDHGDGNSDSLARAPRVDFQVGIPPILPKIHPG